MAVLMRGDFLNRNQIRIQDGLSQTVALCGLRNGADKRGVGAFLTRHKLSAATISETVPPP
jgi:hypothetical protein